MHRDMNFLNCANSNETKAGMVAVLIFFHSSKSKNLDEIGIIVVIFQPCNILVLGIWWFQYMYKDFIFQMKYNCKTDLISISIVLQDTDDI
jgi:hypothetical protein